MKNCNSCKKRWNAFKTKLSNMFSTHDCQYVQIGVWADKHYTSKPIMQCKICGGKIYAGKDD